MKEKILIFAIVALSMVLLAGCAAPTCYPPNKILGNKCCIDDDDNDVCDYEEGAVADKTVVEDTEADDGEGDDAYEPSAPVKEEPQIQKIKAPEPAPIKTSIELGKQEIKLGEPRKYLEINQLSAYRTSRDKGMMDYLVLTVRNIGDSTLNAEVELLFEGARIEEHATRVKKEYTIPALKPGEKYVMNTSLGIRFGEIEKEKKMTLSVYEKYTAPKKDLQVLVKDFIPTDYMESMEIYTYGLPD